MPPLTTGSSALILFVAALLSHGLLLANDGLYWDGWLLNGWQQTKDWPSMRRFFSEVGMPLLYYKHRFMAALPAPLFAYKLVGFVALYSSALFVYLLAVRFGTLTSTDALGIALLVVCFPGAQMLVEAVINVNYMLPVAVFLGACLLGLQSETLTGPLHWISRGGALVLFVFSFNMNSLVMFYGGYALLLLYHHFGTEELGLRSTTWFLLSRLDYWLLPVAFWVGKTKFTPRHGNYATYNKLTISPRQTLRGFRQLMGQGIAATSSDALQNLRRFPVVFAGCSVLCGLAVTLCGVPRLMPPIKAAGLVGFAFGLLLFAGLPYIWVGQPFTRRGWGTKNNILLAYPFALFLVAAGQLVFNRYSYLVLGCVFLSAATVYLNYVHLCWLAVWAKNKSFLINFAQLPDSRNLSIVGVCDRHPIRGSFNDGHPEHSAVYLVYMFTYLYGGVRRLGISENCSRARPYSAEEIAAAIRATTIDYGLAEIDRTGLQGMVIINAGPNCVSEVATGWKYLVYRFFRRKELDRFLSDLTRLEYSQLCVPNSPAAAQAAFDALVSAAKASVNDGKWAEGMVYLLDAVSRRPDHADLYSSIGFCLLNLGREKEGVMYFRKALELLPNHENALALGIACSMSGQTADAETAFKLVLKHAPDDPEAGRSLGELYLGQQRLDEAVEILTRVTSSDPQDIPALLLLAEANQKRGDSARARDCYQGVLAYDANNVEAARSLAKM